jgi:gamma-butyrobetaine dioxygenase
MVEDALTPDFAVHEWQPLESADLDGCWVEVRWADGCVLPCYSLWLFENTVAIDPVTREATVDPADLPSPEILALAGVGSDGALELGWRDGATSRVHPGWLRSIADDRHLPDAMGGAEAWTTSTLSEPPTFDGSHVLDDVDELRRWIDALCTLGLARLRGTPAERTFLARLIERVGPIRGSNFGDVFIVEASLEADSTANTGLNLGQHADLPTRETPPGFQFLHCVENTVAGGASRMTDGLSVVEALASEHGDEFEALTTLDWVFANRARDGDHRWIGPIIDHTSGRSALTMRAFYPVRLAPYMDAADVPRAYAAMRVFSQVAHDPRFMLRSRFEPGDLVGFDNRRVLHGRDSFDPGGGTRVLTGCYVDRDDVLSRRRVLHRSGRPS